MLVSLTVGKVDAGMAVLLTEDKRIIEFPSILLPSDISSGSIVDITVSRNHTSESQAQKSFHSLQSTIYQTFGVHSPSSPVLRCRNATQTSVVLEWDPIELATAELRSLSLYRNGSKAGSIPRPHEMTSTKISGLAVDTEYTFQLVLRTSAGTSHSEKLVVRTHKMTDLTGITISTGVMPGSLRESLLKTVESIGAKVVEQVRIDTTHFVCTEGRGAAWEKAVDMNIPVVVPDWVKGCEREGRLVGVRGYYLNADPKLRQVGPSVTQQQQQQQQGANPIPDDHPMKSPPPITHVTPPTPERPTREREVDEDPPTPPPKPEGPGSSREMVDRTGGASQKEMGAAGLASEDSEEEAGPAKGKEPAGMSDAEASLRQATVGDREEDEKTENGSFQDVAL